MSRLGMERPIRGRWAQTHPLDKTPSQYTGSFTLDTNSRFRTNYRHRAGCHVTTESGRTTDTSRDVSTGSNDAMCSLVMESPSLLDAGNDSPQNTICLYDELSTLYQKWSDEDGKDLSPTGNAYHRDPPHSVNKESTSDDSSCPPYTDLRELYNPCPSTPKSQEGSISSALNQMYMTLVRNQIQAFPNQEDSPDIRPKTSSNSNPAQTRQTRHQDQECLSSFNSSSATTFFRTPSPTNVFSSSPKASLSTLPTNLFSSSCTNILRSSPKDRSITEDNQHKVHQLLSKPRHSPRLDYFSGGRNDRIMGSVNYCSLCKKNGETREFYTSHVIKDTRGNVVCPVLREYVCPECGATGPKSHTLSYCPVMRRKKW